MKNSGGLAGAVESEAAKMMGGRRAGKWIQASLLTLLPLVAIAGCGTDEPEMDVELAKSNLGFTGMVVYDSGTVCTVGGLSMHCCPTNWAMIGANLAANRFKCAQLSGIRSVATLSNTVVRNNMRACPFGQVMVGYHGGANSLACQTPSPAVTGEFVDGNPPTSDGQMHVCPNPRAMSGIHAGSNLFTCAI